MFSFKVDGKPIAKARPRVARNGVIYTPKTTQDAERRIRDAFLEAVEHSDYEFDEGSVCVNIDFIFAPPKSTTKARAKTIIGEPRPKKPDVDNLCKTVLDALNGFAWDDDNQVTHLSARKVYGTEDSTIVTIEELR